VPWIHRDDAVRAIMTALTDERYAGPINLVAGSVRNAELSRALGKALGRPSWLPVPGFALRAAVGEFADYVLHGRRVIPRRLQELGFTWTYPDLADALAHR
jgi:NAD dependent epimerase/dehydratase family enzyme